MKNTVNTACIFFLLIIFLEGGWQLNITSSSAPIDTDKYTVVIVEETESRQSLPPSQLNAINSQVWRDYVVSQNGQWRVLDPHTDVSKDEQWAKDSLAVSRTSLPWLIFADSKTGYSGPLPDNLTEFLEKIKK